MGPRILKSKRVLFDLTQEEIAKELGITIKSYNAKENGKREFTLDEAKKIINDAVNLNVNINEFIELLLALNSADIIRNRDLSVIDSYTNKPLLDTVKEEYEFKKRLLQQAVDMKNSETIAENKRKIYD